MQSILARFKNFAIQLTAVVVAVSASPLALVNQAQAASQALTPSAKVSFTFDDGLASTATLAAPTLAKYGYSATDYVTTGCIGMTTAPNTCHANTSATYMSWPQVTSLKNTYGWEIGSHTATHPYLASKDATDGQPNVLTVSQVITELTQSKNDLLTQGFIANSFATPYGDYLPPTIAQVAKVYANHRGFADTGYNVFPYNDYLIRDQRIQASDTPVATALSYIDSAKASGQWLVLTFHEIKASGASTNIDDYEYNNADLDTIAAYVKAQGIPVVNVGNGLSLNDGNLLPNGSFDNALSTVVTDGTVWSTDDPTNIKQDTGTNGSVPSATNSVSLSASTVDRHLFSPQVSIDSTKKYVLKNFLSLSAITAGKLSFYIDEYDTNGVWLGGKNYAGETVAITKNENFEYIPSSATVKRARLQIIVSANSGVKAFVDNIQWFAEDGSTTTIGGGVAKAGDINGDNLVNALDLSVIASNWQKTGMTKAQGDLNADGTVNALDLSILGSNWGK